jgi:hypothetical protein
MSYCVVCSVGGLMSYCIVCVCLLYWCLTLCPILCNYVLGSVLWSQLRFPHESDVLFVITSLFVGGLMSYLCYYFYLSRIVMSNTHWLYDQHGGCLIRGMDCLSFVNTWVNLRFFVGSAFLIFLVFCVVVFFSLFVFVVCLVHPMLSVSLIAHFF